MAKYKRTESDCESQSPGIISSAMVLQQRPSAPHRETFPDPLFGLISHELRSPLSVILGFAGRARRQPYLPDDVSDALDEIAQQASRINRIVEDMLLLASSESSLPDCEPVLLQHELSRIVHQHQRIHPGSRVTECAAHDLPPVLAEPTYLQQVVLNLLSNAVKYSPAGSPIWVTAAIDDEGNAQISVLDRGPGIPADDLQQVFGPFFRSPATAQFARGVGLGLAVCKRMVEAQGGLISLANRPDGGLEASFTLQIIPLDSSFN
jgi:two-component system, OmpR family, sensor histidine kinase KdpD